MLLPAASSLTSVPVSAYLSLSLAKTGIIQCFVFHSKQPSNGLLKPEGTAIVRVMQRLKTATKNFCICAWGFAGAPEPIGERNETQQALGNRYSRALSVPICFQLMPFSKQKREKIVLLFYFLLRRMSAAAAATMIMTAAPMAM